MSNKNTKFFLLHSSIDTAVAWKRLSFILSVRSDFHMTDSLLIVVHAFASHVLMSVSVDLFGKAAGAINQLSEEFRQF